MDRCTTRAEFHQALSALTEWLVDGMWATVESAVSHVVQQRMKRVGMRWCAAGADAMLALRSLYRTTGAWEPFWVTRPAA